MAAPSAHTTVAPLGRRIHQPGVPLAQRGRTHDGRTVAPSARRVVAPWGREFTSLGQRPGETGRLHSFRPEGAAFSVANPALAMGLLELRLFWARWGLGCRLPAALPRVGGWDGPRRVDGPMGFVHSGGHISVLSRDSKVPSPFPRFSGAEEPETPSAFSGVSKNRNGLAAEAGASRIHFPGQPCHPRSEDGSHRTVFSGGAHAARRWGICVSSSTDRATAGAGQLCRGASGVPTKMRLKGFPRGFIGRLGMGTRLRAGRFGASLSAQDGALASKSRFPGPRGCTPDPAGCWASGDGGGGRVGRGGRRPGRCGRARCGRRGRRGVVGGPPTLGAPREPSGHPPAPGSKSPRPVRSLRQGSSEATPGVADRTRREPGPTTGRANWRGPGKGQLPWHGCGAFGRAVARRPRHPRKPPLLRG